MKLVYLSEHNLLYLKEFSSLQSHSKQRPILDYKKSISNEQLLNNYYALANKKSDLIAIAQQESDSKQSFPQDKISELQSPIEPLNNLKFPQSAIVTLEVINYNQEISSCHGFMIGANKVFVTDLNLIQNGKIVDSIFAIPAKSQSNYPFGVLKANKI